MGWILVLVFHLSITKVETPFATEENCHIAGKAWMNSNRNIITSHPGYACLPANFVNAK